MQIVYQQEKFLTFSFPRLPIIGSPPQQELYINIFFTVPLTHLVSQQWGSE
jgi:hypothetical protein